MRTRILPLTLLLVANTFYLPNSLAQSVAFPDLESTEAALTIATPYPALFEDATVDGYDYLEASLEVEEKAASVSWAPLLLTDKYYPVLSETRLKIGTKDKVTSFGVSFKYNPFNARGPFGRSIQPKSIDPTRQSAVTENKRFRIKLLKEEVFSELTKFRANNCLKTLESLKSLIPSDPTAVVLNAELANLRCELVNADRVIKALDVRISSASGDELKNLNAQKKNWTKPFTEGLALAERGYIFEHNMREAANSSTREVSKLEMLRTSIAALTAEVAAEDKNRSEKLYLDYRKQLFAGYLPIVNFSHVTSFFEVIGGGNFDSDGDGNNDYEHSVKSRVLSLTADWRFNERNQVSLLLSKSEERASAAAGTPKVDYDGFGLTWTHRIRVLNKDGYTKSKDYKESLFVPSINVGVAFERKDCESPNSDCVDGILRTKSITPFIDFKITKKAQFRIGVPFKKSRNFKAGMEGEEDSVELRALLAFQLGAPK